MEQAAQLAQQLEISQNETVQATEEAAVVQVQLKSVENTNATLQSEVSEFKIQSRVMAKEYEVLQQTFRAEQLTVIRPVYRNLYRKTGLLFRKTFPSSWVESIKRTIPSPDGVPKRLMYQPQKAKTVVASLDEFSARSFDASPDVFIFSIINWDFRYQRPQHIAKGLADSGCRVFYVEMGLVSGATRIEKISDNLYCVKLSLENIGHIQPYTGKPDGEQIKNWILALYDFCESVKATSFKQIVIQHPFWWQLAQHLPPEFQLIFDCMDDISGFSNTEQFLLDLEHDMLQKCDKLIVSSQYLSSKYKHYQSPKLIRNAAELGHFCDVRKQAPPSFLKHSVTGCNVVKVGYVGAIAEWFDAELIKDSALLESGFEFHLCGAVTVQEAAQLAEIENINMYGEIAYSDVPDFLREMDVLIIPFKIIPIINACDPVKFYEYSAMGKPTVTTKLPELSRASDLTFFASTPTEFVEQIHNAYKAGKKRKFRMKVREYATKNTWRHRVTQFKKELRKTPKVSVVILSYGDPELTKAALHSLYDGGAVYLNLEVIVVDNGSCSSDLAEIEKFAKNYSSVKVIENGENLGFAKGNNIGIDAAFGDYVMLLNNDTVVAPGAISAMVRHLERNPVIGVVGPLTNNIGNEAKLFVEYEDMGQMKDIARQATTGYRGIATPVNVAAYFAVMFRRIDFAIFGLLSEEYGRGMFEDDDHCATIKSKGYACAIAEDAYVHHHLSATFSKLKEGEKELLFERNKKTFEKKWGDWQPHMYRTERPAASLDKGS